MALTILSIISEVLPILDKLIPDQATKIRNELLKLRGEWDEEISKGDKRDDAMLDNIMLRISDLCQLFSATIKQASSSDKLN